ncbi:DUF6146 family protein [Maribacter arenosus]|uniref:Lipoprotein n=1 Tax=Maribacter arenosus TaxID=1854708 RepID=A0ABR7VBG0_9FLAO|nr:hypothetical protein [Maribacter arenosus]
MKHRFFQIFGFLLVMVVIGSSCGSTKEAITVSDEEKLAFAKQEGDTIKIASNDIEYEIIIIEPGFNFWLQSIAKPEGYYTQSYLENRNKIYVTEWNQRVLQPFRYDPSLYELQIDYSPNIDYGYEVNYKLFNYFIYFQRKYNQRLGPFLPRI